MDNPAVDNGSEGPGEEAQSRDEEEAQSCSGDNINAEETVRLLVDVIDGRVASSTQNGGTGGQEVVGVTQALLAHLVRADTAPPSNFHQVTVFFLTSSDPLDAALRGSLVTPALLVGSCTMVLIQSATVVSIFMGSLMPACQDDDMCERGTFCEVDLIRRCQQCGATIPLPIQTDDAGNTYNYYREPDFIGYNDTGLAELCANPVVTPGTASVGEPMIFGVRSLEAWCVQCFTATRPGEAGIVNPMTAVMTSLPTRWTQWVCSIGWRCSSRPLSWPSRSSES
eukprot:COSAG06_NODE_1393_length_9596_cov_47.877014_3_plen_282_part_00